MDDIPGFDVEGFELVPLVVDPLDESPEEDS